MEKYIKNAALQFGADVCGIGSIDRFADAPKGFSPLDLYDKCKSVIAVGIALPKGLYEVDSRLMYGHFNAEVDNSIFVHRSPFYHKKMKFCRKTANKILKKCIFCAKMVLKKCIVDEKPEVRYVF